MNYTPSLKKQAVSLFIGKVLAFIVQFLTPVILVRLLSKTDYGIYQQFNLLAGTLLPVLGLCLSTSLFYFHPVSEEEDRSIFIIQTFCILSVVGIIFLFVFVTFDNSILNILNLSVLKSYKYIIPFYILFMLISSITDFLFILEKNIKYNLIFYPVERVVRLVLIISFVFSTKNIQGCLIALLCFSFIRFIFISIYIIKRYFTNSKKIFRYQFIVEQFKYSLPFLGGLILRIVSTKYDKFLINSYVDPSQYAIYSVAFISIPLLHLLFSSTGNVLMPEISYHAKLNNKEKIMDLWHKVIKKRASVSIPFIIFFFIMSNEFIELLYTEDYAKSAFYFKIYLLSLLFFMIGHGFVLRGFKKTGLIFRARTIGSITTVLLGYFLIKKFYLTGAIVTALIGIGLPVIVIWYYESKIMDLKISNLFPWKQLNIISLISIFSCLLVLPIKYVDMSNFLTLLIGAIIYFPVVFLAEYKSDLFILPQMITKPLSCIKKWQGEFKLW